MAYPHIITYADAIQHCVGVLGGNSSQAAHDGILRAIQAGYRELLESRRWTYLLTFYRVRVEAPYETGTVEYDHTGGATERRLTLSSGTWPTWAVYGSVKIADKWHKVTTRVSSTVLTLDATLNPGADIAAGTSYKIIQSQYSLPTNFVSLDQPYEQDLIRFGRYVRPNEFMGRERYGEATGDPKAFTIIGDADNLGQSLLHTLWEPTATEELDFFYYRRPREIILTGYQTAHTAGTVATAGTTTLTGTSTTFDSGMVGSIVRVSSNSTVPTGVDGRTPYAEQRVLSAFASATSMTVSATFTGTRSAVKYIISDPLDLEANQFDAFYRCVEKHLAIIRGMRDVKDRIEMYAMELERAASVDASRIYKPRQVGDGQMHGARPPDAVPPESI